MSIPESLRDLTVLAGDVSLRLRLREPATGEVIPLILDADLRVPRLIEPSLLLELQAVIDTIDGEVPTELSAGRILASPEALAQVLLARRSLYHHLAERGRAFARCPCCGEHDSEVDLLFYWMTLKLPPWDFFDPTGMLLGQPSLSSRLPTGRRPPGVPLASRLAFRYPGEVAIEGTLRSLQTEESDERERRAWAKWLPAAAGSEERTHWRANSTGFRAILRLSVAMDPDPEEVSLSPEVIEELPLGAFLFLDLLHFAANNVDVPADGRVVLECPRCGGRFLPLS